jgi:zinc resistance-associated protein
MRTSPKSLAVVLALVLSLGLAASALARGPFGGGPGCANLTPDQAGKLFDLKEKFRTDTASLRKQLLLKHLELRKLWAAEKPDEKQILAKQKEINPLREQLQEKMTVFRLEARKIAPNARFGLGCGLGHGFGHGHGFGMGPGGGMGPGMGPGPGGGMGPGKAM